VKSGILEGLNPGIKKAKHLNILLFLSEYNESVLDLTAIAIFMNVK
jgi:hypothetical protein